MKRHKYSAVKVVTEDGTFDSKAEHKRWCQLKLLQKAGEISDLKRQERLELVAGVHIAGEARKRPPVRLYVDFSYVDTKTGEKVYEDVKGMRELPVFRLKQHLAALFLGVDVRVVR